MYKVIHCNYVTCDKASVGRATYQSERANATCATVLKMGESENQWGDFKNGVANDLISRKCSLHAKKEVMHTCVVRGNGLTGGRRLSY